MTCKDWLKLEFSFTFLLVMQIVMIDTMYKNIFPIKGCRCTGSFCIDTGLCSWI